MYLKVYYHNGRLTDESDREDIQQHLDTLQIPATINYNLGHAAVDLSDDSNIKQLRRLQADLKSAGYETE